MEELTSIEFEARFKVRSCEFLGKVFGLTEAIRLLLRFRTVSFGSRRSCTRLRRKWRSRRSRGQDCLKEPEGGDPVVSEVELDQAT